MKNMNIDGDIALKTKSFIKTFGTENFSKSVSTILTGNT